MRTFLLLISISLLLCFLNSCTPDQILDNDPPVMNDCGSCCNYLQFDSTAFDIALLTAGGLDSSAAEYKITEACAKCLINNFKKNGYVLSKIETDTGTTNVKGFIMQNPEIKAFSEMIDIITKDSILNTMTNLNIYSVFGIYYGQLSRNSTKTVTIPHQLYLVESELEIERSNKLRLALGYYNFIRPCPDFCPANIAELEHWEPRDCE
jgi:hypothetical protein